MTNENIEKLMELDKAGDAELESRIDKAESLNDIVEALADKGIEISEEDLSPTSDQLSEEDLEMVSGGGALFWPNLGFFNGYTTGLQEDKGNNKHEKKGGILFRIGYKCARIISGTWY